MFINDKKLRKYLGSENVEKQEMILEFKNEFEAMEYYITYCFEKFENLKEFREFLGLYGFNHKNKFYVIMFDSALDIYNKGE